MDIVKEIEFRIGEVSKRTGLSVKQIRYIEERYLKEPISRIQYGMRKYRFFCKRDLEMLKDVKRYQEKGYTLKSACYRALGGNLKGK